MNFKINGITITPKQMSDKIIFNSLVPEFRSIYFEQNFQEYDSTLCIRTEQIFQRTQLFKRELVGERRNDYRAATYEIIARQNISEKNYDKAIELILLGLQTNPKDEQVTLLLIGCLTIAYLAKHDFDNLIKKTDGFLIKYADFNSIKVKLFYSLVSAYGLKEDYKRAIHLAQEGLALARKEPDRDMRARFHESLACIYLKMCKYDLAFESASSGLVENPVDPSVVLALHKNIFSSFVMQTDPEAILERIILESESHPEQLKFKEYFPSQVQVQGSDQEIEQVSENLKESLSNPDFCALLCARLSVIFILDSRLDLAMQFTKLGLRESPIKDNTKVALYEKTANIYYRMEKYHEASETLKICFELNSDNILQHRLRALQEQILKALNE